MSVEFDPAKDEANVAKHGVSLALAAELDLAECEVIVDDRRDYGEARFNAFGEIDGVFYALCFTIRGEAMRAISLRRASPAEVESWRK